MTTWENLVSIYRDRRVLVTGHTGFKGSWLCSWLLMLGAKVGGLALEPEAFPNLFDDLRLAERTASNIGDIRNCTIVRRVIEEFQPEIIFHAAAQSLVRRSYADPLATFATNILGTAHVLDAARAVSSVRAIVVVTTDKVYDNSESMRPFREIDPLGGLDPYSASKAAVEIVAAVYQKNLCRDNIAIATARGGNVIGGGDWSEDRIVPDIVRAIDTNEPLVLRNPDAIRPWQHVLELCEAYLELGVHLLEPANEFAEAWNFGPDNSEQLTVGELAKMFLDNYGRPGHPTIVQTSSLHEAQTLRLDIAKALSRLSWRPRLGVRKALAWTAHWYKAYDQQPLNARNITEDQLRSFAGLMNAL
jgi:CDP-glucose 4,6-dehydratase